MKWSASLQGFLRISKGFLKSVLPPKQVDGYPVSEDIKSSCSPHIWGQPVGMLKVSNIAFSCSAPVLWTSIWIQMLTKDTFKGILCEVSQIWDRKWHSIAATRSYKAPVDGQAQSFSAPLYRGPYTQILLVRCYTTLLLLKQDTEHQHSWNTMSGWLSTSTGPVLWALHISRGSRCARKGIVHLWQCPVSKLISMVLTFVCKSMQSVCKSLDTILQSVHKVANRQKPRQTATEIVSYNT